MAEKGAVRFDDLMADLRNRIYSPVYLLHGEESYFIDTVADYIEENVLNESEKEFNQTIAYGKDSNVANLIGYAKRFPMMANYQVLIIREAQDLDKIEDLQSYVENPLSSTLLVICYKYGKLDKRKGLYKAIEKRGVAFESARLYDNKVPEWITDFLKQRGYTISHKAAALLTEFVGADLGKIVNELQKLLINLPAGTEITDAIIEKNIGISKDFNVFELQKALAQRDVVRANRIIFHFAANLRENPLVKILPILFAFFSKVLAYHFLTDRSTNSVAAALGVKPFFVTDYQQAARTFPVGRTVEIIALLREYDLKAKGVDNASATDGELMKELVFRLLH